MKAANACIFFFFRVSELFSGYKW